MQTTKFKIGDMVRVINKHEHNPVKIGQVGAIQEINLLNPQYPYLISTSTCWLKEEWLVPAIDAREGLLR